VGLENYTFYRAAIWSVAHLPRGFLTAAVRLIADLNYLLSTRSRRGVLANQAHVLPADTPPKERRRLARETFRYSGYALLDFFRIPTMNRDNLDQFVAEVIGWEHLAAAMQARAGGILVSPHIGSWELAGAYQGLRGVPVSVVALTHPDPRVNEIFLNTRREAGIESVPVEGALQRLREALARGRITAVLADRDVSGHGLKLPFFGQLLRVPAGHAVLALRTGAWLLPCCVYRRPDGRVAMEFRPPIVPDRKQDTTTSLTLRCLKILEEFISARPEQWSCFYDLWNPPPEASL
jgi:lauroyl/myristoyl acyltransferase